MASVNQIRELVQKYLAGEIGADSFIANFSELSYNIHKLGDQGAIWLSGKVQLWLGRCQAGLISQDELRQSLNRLVVGERSVEISVSILPELTGASIPLSFPIEISSVIPDPVTGIVIGGVDSFSNALPNQLLPPLMARASHA